MTIHVISVSDQSMKFRAYVADYPQRWAESYTSAAEAVGLLVMLQEFQDSGAGMEIVDLDQVQKVGA